MKEEEKTTERINRPETLMMSLGYKPHLSEGALKCPIFQTSTFVFKSAEEGKHFFEMIYSKEGKKETENMGLIYTRINNPDIEILENRIAIWDEGEDCAVFESGMAAISTSLLEFLRPNDVVLTSSPIYGGTNHFMKEILPKFNIHTLTFNHNDDEQQILNLLQRHNAVKKIKSIYIETPANPTNSLIDIQLCKRVAEILSKEVGEKVWVMVDNTYLGPLWQHPLKHGADLVLYSATKYIGGHSDVVAGAAVGSAMLSFNVVGGEKEAFTFLNALQVVKLAVSLGGTETLAQHPNTMTHADVPAEEKLREGITSKMIRLSVGIEAVEDIIYDVKQALDKIK
ncbi:hypothetical protein CHS0354_000777 [Potamilus streckersoni]|uniref:Methionine gamma-lyase n=1 Tax=Potamilus streckersoni TaxID=2493646 RepID=A0AAE0T7C0_9BIVA|nr:hypothetical protein CHS0354_000777 [Potamilus streckersoni]